VRSIPLSFYILPLTISKSQDTNIMQYELMRHIASANHCVTIVGDPDQSSASDCLPSVSQVHKWLQSMVGALLKSKIFTRCEKAREHYLVLLNVETLIIKFFQTFLPPNRYCSNKTIARLGRS
jgi:hypothetical protein